MLSGVSYWPAMTLGGAAQVAAAHCPNERTLDPAVCSYNRPTYAPASRTMAFALSYDDPRKYESYHKMITWIITQLTFVWNARQQLGDRLHGWVIRVVMWSGHVLHKPTSRWALSDQWLGGVVVRGVGLVINRLRARLPAVHCWVSTLMGDRLWAGKPSRYVTSHIRQLSLLSLRGR